MVAHTRIPVLKCLELSNAHLARIEGLQCFDDGPRHPVAENLVPVVGEQDLAGTLRRETGKVRCLSEVPIIQVFPGICEMAPRSVAEVGSSVTHAAQVPERHHRSNDSS